MHREIETFVSACLLKMKEKRLTQSDLVKQGGSVSMSTLGHLLRQDRQPTAVTLERVGAVLGIERATIQAAVKFARRGAAGIQWKKVPPKVEEAEKPTFDSIEARLHRAFNHFQKGAEELKGIDSAIEAVLSDISERIRATSALKNHLSVFLKH